MTRKYQLRLLRNLLLAFLLALFLWYLKGCPLPAAELELHRAERQILQEESRVIWSSRRLKAVVGLSRDYIHVYNDRLTLWPRTEGHAALVLLGYRSQRSEVPFLDAHPSFLVVDPPEEAARAKFTMDLSGSIWLPRDPGLYRAEAARDGSTFLLALDTKYNGGHPLCDGEHQTFLDLLLNPEPETLAQYAYTLEFFDADGKLLDTVTTPSTQEVNP